MSNVKAQELRIISLLLFELWILAFVIPKDLSLVVLLRR
jgi:hypothetical protein